MALVACLYAAPLANMRVGKLINLAVASGWLRQILPHAIRQSFFLLGPLGCRSVGDDCIRGAAAGMFALVWEERCCVDGPVLFL